MCMWVLCLGLVCVRVLRKGERELEGLLCMCKGVCVGELVKVCACV